jgi:hypothetical protein
VRTEKHNIMANFRTLWKPAVAVGILIFIVLVISRIADRPPFDPNKIAVAETRMWKAYYSGDPITVGRELVGLMRSQFGLSIGDSMEVSQHLAVAAAKFQSMRGNYGPAVLPDLEQAYTRLKELSGEAFDPKEAARAELDWWVARRTPGIDSPEEVGRRIAHLYAVLYGEDRPGFHTAGRLRAQAAELRDMGGAQCDWIEVERLLRESYQALVKAL